MSFKTIFNKVFLLAVSFFLQFTIFSQEGNGNLVDQANKNALIERSIENIAEGLEDDNIDFTNLFDVLTSFYENPINLNAKNIKGDLLETQLLTEFQVNDLLKHIETNGKLMSVYELQAINGFDNRTISNLLPFVTVNTNFYSPNTSFKDMITNSSSELFLRYTRILEDQKGYREVTDEEWLDSKNTRYLGNQDRLYTRYRFRYLNNVSIGFTAEKDAGESFFGNQRATELFGLNQQKGFDFYSAHFYLSNIGKVKGLAIGDYHIQLGQGLTFWTGLAFGKSIDVMSYKRNAQGIRPYASVDENNFLRGAAVTLAPIKNIEVTAFGSRKNIDANLQIDDNENPEDNDGLVSTFTSFQASGNHNTVATLEDKDLLQETYVGGNVKYVNNNLQFGLTGIYSSFGGDINRALQPYSQFQFNSNTNVNIGADYNYIYKNFNVYGELSRSANGGVGQVHGLLASLDPKLSLSMVYRNYDADYQSVRSTAFSDGSTNVNEKGLIVGLEAKPNLKWTISAYMDQFKYPWLRFQVDQPNTAGYDGMLQVKYKHSKKLEMYGRIRNRQRLRNTSEEITAIKPVVNVEDWFYRFNISYKISESIQLKNRVEYRTFQKGTAPQETGYLAYQDITYKPKSSPLSFTFRYALFEMTSYDARIWAYESNVLYAFSIPAYFNRGTRTQLTVRYRIRKGIDLWLRWAQWHYNDVESIGSGLDEITGNNKTEVKAQLRFKF